MRYQFMVITLSKPHLVCTFYNKQIIAKKYKCKFGCAQIIMARQCILNRMKINGVISVVLFVFGDKYAVFLL